MAENPPSHPPSNPSPPSLSTLLTTRHSTRAFLPTPVPTSLLHSALSLARHAPSNSNMQNWRIALATGSSRDRIVSALFHTASTHTGPSAIPPLPPGMKSYRDDFVQLLYGPAGYDVLGDDPTTREARQEKRLANFRFFDAPVIGIVYQEKKMGRVDAMCVGMFVENFLLKLWEGGVGSCCQVSVTGFSDVLVREFGLEGEGGEEGVEILCGLAIGYEDTSKRENGVRTGRDEIGSFAKVLNEWG